MKEKKRKLKNSPHLSNSKMNVVLSGLPQHIIAQNFGNKPVVAIQNGKVYRSVMFFLLC